MGNQAAWLEAFEQREGRKPSIDEFLTAKAADFPLSVVNSPDAGRPTASTGPGDSAASADPINLEAWQTTTSQQTIALPAVEDSAPTQLVDSFTAPTATRQTTTPSPAQTATWSPDLETASATAFQPAEPLALDTVADISYDSDQSSPTTTGPRSVNSSQATATASPRHLKLILWLIGVAVILIGLLVGAYFFGRNYFSQENQLQRYVAAYNSSGVKGDLADYVWADNGQPLSAREVSNLGSLPKTISTAHTLPGMSFEQVGRQYLFFPVYKMAVNPQQLIIRSNAKGLTFSMNGKTVGQSSQADDSIVLKTLFPATYRVTATGTVSAQAINLDSTQKLFSGKGTADFRLQFISFNLYSNLDNGEIYTGNQKIGALKAGHYKFVDLPVLADETIRVQKTFPDGTVKTRPQAVADISDGDSVYLNWQQGLTTNAATSLMQSAFTAINDYWNKTTDDNVSDIFQGGKTNSFWKALADPIDQQHANANGPETMDYDNINVTSIKQTGVNAYTVSFQNTEDLYYDNQAVGVGDTNNTYSWAVTVQYTGKDAGSGDSDDSTSDTTNSDLEDNTGDDEANFVIVSAVGKSKLISSQNNIQPW